MLSLLGFTPFYFISVVSWYWRGTQFSWKLRSKRKIPTLPRFFLYHSCVHMWGYQVILFFSSSTIHEQRGLQALKWLVLFCWPLLWSHSELHLFLNKDLSYPFIALNFSASHLEIKRTFPSLVCQVYSIRSLKHDLLLLYSPLPPEPSFPYYVEYSPGLKAFIFL